MKYRTKPYEVEAIRFIGVVAAKEIESWSNHKVTRYYSDITHTLTPTLMIIDKEYRDQYVNRGDWVVKYNGEFNPCKNDVFVSLYEKVVE